MKIINDTSSIPHLLIQEIMHTCFGGEVNSCASWYLNPKMGRQLAAGIFHKCAKVLPPAQLTKVKGAFALFRPVLGTRQRIYNTAWWHLETHHRTMVTKVSCPGCSVSVSWFENSCLLQVNRTWIFWSPSWRWFSIWSNSRSGMITLHDNIKQRLGRCISPIWSLITLSATLPTNWEQKALILPVLLLATYSS